MILAGDKRSEPILAFSENNNFPIDAEFYPSGLVDWLYDSKESIQKIRNENLKATKEVKKKWNNLSNGDADVVTYRIEPPDDDDCTITVTQKGPYLQTTWGQGCGYNSLLPQMSCDVPCGRAYTGCVATAMAQIMRYHEFPNNYNWTNMPNNSGTIYTATLMKDIGNAVGMEYKCDGSGSDTKNEVASSFRNDFGYSTASYADYNYQTVKSELNYRRPVVLRGGRKSGWWIFAKYVDAHAWVCDGYLSHVDPCWGSTLKFYMHWGWGNGSYNGWYGFNNFNPGDNTYNYKTGMVYNIKP